MVWSMFLPNPLPNVRPTPNQTAARNDVGTGICRLIDVATKVGRLLVAYPRSGRKKKASKTENDEVSTRAASSGYLDASVFKT
jgi:hypothetical protein